MTHINVYVYIKKSNFLNFLNFLNFPKKHEIHEIHEIREIINFHENIYNLKKYENIKNI